MNCVSIFGKNKALAFTNVWTSPASRPSANFPAYSPVNTPAGPHNFPFNSVE